MAPHKATVIKNNLPEFSSYIFGLPYWIHDCRQDFSAKPLYLDSVPHWRYVTLLRDTQKHTQDPLGCAVQSQLLLYISIPLSNRLGDSGALDVGGGNAHDFL